MNEKIDHDNQKCCLVTTDYKYHLDQSQPVMDELKKRGWKIVHFDFYKIFNSALFHTVKAIHRIIYKIKYFLGGDKGIYNMETPMDEDVAYSKIHNRIIPKILYFIIVTFKIKQPDIIIVSAFGFFDVMTILTGRLLGIPILMLQIGLGHDAFKNIKPLFFFESKYLMDKIALMGESSKNYFMKWGFDDDVLSLTGRPVYDQLFEVEKKFDKEKTFEKLGLDKDKKLIVWTTEPELLLDEDWGQFYAVYNSIKQLSDKVQLVIKLHPRELDDYMYKKIAKEVGIEPVILKGSANLYEILYACDLMVTKRSNTVIEAAILDKPSITMNFLEEEDTTHYSESGAVLTVFKEEDLIININKILYDEETQEKLKNAREKFVYGHVYGGDGKATERVVNLIEDMVTKKKLEKLH